MSEQDNKNIGFGEDTAHTFPRSFVPQNRRKDAVVFRNIRERIRTGYYESGAVLKRIAEKITGTR